MIGDVKTEFPLFDEELPSIDGFVDRSWHNEPCPCMINEELQLLLFIDFKNPDLAEYPEERKSGNLQRFMILRLDTDGGITDELILSTDDLDAVRAFVADWKAKSSYGRFPDFDDTMPVLRGFMDASHMFPTASCPTFIDKELDLVIHYDYKDPKLSTLYHERLNGTAHRFSVVERDESGFLKSDALLETDDWDDVVAFVKTRRNEPDNSSHKP